jgi:hypothetical protein
MTMGVTQSSVVLVRFGAQSTCEGSGGWCSVRIMVAPPGLPFQEMLPADGTNFVWQWSGSNWGQTSMDRHDSYVMLQQSSFKYFTFKVQVALRNGATRFRLQDWTLAAEIF